MNTKQTKKMVQISLFLGIFSLLHPLDVVARRSAPWVGYTFDGRPCRGGMQGFGPWDYTHPEDRVRLSIVETHHFTAEVEQLIAGKSASIMGDLDYTLRAFPNHHRALIAAQRHQQKLKISQETPIECYYQKAIRFSPKDGMTHMLFAIFLHKAGYMDKAEKEYHVAENLLPNDAGLNYNMGLFYLEKKQYKLAKERAKKAYSIGYPFPGLKNRLKKLGHW